MGVHAAHDRLLARVGFDLDVVVVRVGAAASLLTMCLYLVIAGLTGDVNHLVSALGPALAFVAMAAQIYFGQESGAFTLLVAGIIVALFSFTVYQAALIPAALALVVIASIGMIFVKKHTVEVAAATGAALFGIPHLWPVASMESLVLGSMMTLSFLMTFMILLTIYRSVVGVNMKYQLLFEQSPTAVLEEDWSACIEHVHSEYDGPLNRIEQFLEAYPDVLREAVGRARVIRANDAALRLLEIKDEKIFLGPRNPVIINDENLADFAATLAHLCHGDTTWEQELPTRSREGQLRWLLTRVTVTPTTKFGSTCVIALTDITSIKARNVAMEEMVRQKNEFIARVSHELRTPLTAVVGLTSELVDSSSVAMEERADLIEVVAQQANEMSEIIEDLLVAARADMGTIALDLQPVDLVEELRGTMRGLDVLVELPEAQPPRVLADPQRVRQILRNLLTNAVRYGGPNCRVLAGSLLSRVWFEIRDDGEGIGNPKNVFEPFVTEERDVPGSVGLGLSVARQLAEMMSGSLTYHRQGEESVFRLELPVAVEPAESLASKIEVG